MMELEEVVLGHDEIEAMRLKHLLGLSQEEAAGQMNISQPTFHRLLSSACEKITDAHRQREGAPDRGRQYHTCRRVPGLPAGKAGCVQAAGRDGQRDREA